MPRILLTGTLLILTLALSLGCSSSGKDPVLGEPVNTQIQQVRIGNHIVDFDGTNLIYMNGAGEVRVDVNQSIEMNAIMQSVQTHIIMTPESSPAYSNPLLTDDAVLDISRLEMDANGSLSLVDRELGIVAWRPTSGHLGTGLQPGVRYRVEIKSFFSELGRFDHESIAMANEEFLLLPLSTPKLDFDTRLETDGLVNRILIGNRQVNRGDSEYTQIPMDAANTVQVELATNIDPSFFVGSLTWDLVINNLTTNQSFVFTTTDLLANGSFSFPNPAQNNVILWTKNDDPGTEDDNGLRSFKDAESGQTFTVSNIGDELEIRIDRVTGKIANGDQLTLRDRVFRVLHTYS